MQSIKIIVILALVLMAVLLIGFLLDNSLENDIKKCPRWTSGVIEKFDPERNIIIFVRAENFNYKGECHQCKEWKITNPEQLGSQGDYSKIEIQYIAFGIFRCDCDDKVVPIIEILRTREKI